MAITPSALAIIDVLRNKAFRFLWFAQVASQLGVNMLIFLLGLVIYEKTGSNTAVSLLYLSYGIPALLFGIISGVVVDHVDKRVILFSCDLTRAVMVCLLIGSIGYLPVIYIFVFVNACINQFYVPAEAPTIPRLVPNKQIMTANSLFSFTYYASMAIGFIAAGPVFQFLGARFGLLLIAGMFTAAAWLIYWLPAQGDGLASLRRAVKHQIGYLVARVISDIRQGFIYIRKSPPLYDALVLLTGTQVIIAILGTLGPGFADQALQINIHYASTVIIGPLVAGMVLGALWVGNFGYRYPARGLIHTGIISAGSVLVLIAVCASFLTAFRTSGEDIGNTLLFFLILFLFFLLGIANSLLDIPANATLQQASESTMRGRVYGVLAAVIGGVGILPVVVGGILADTFGVSAVICVLGIGILSYGVLRLRYNIKGQDN